MSSPTVSPPQAQATSECAVDVSDLSIVYGSRTNPTVVVDGASFTIKAGSTLALVGESGSGKSTVANALLGHLRSGARLARGDVEVCGKRVLELSEPALRAFRGTDIALVPQNAGHALTPSMRIGKQMGELPALTTLGPDERQRRVEQALAQVDLPRSFARRYPHQLSGGQQQRVGIAMALLVSPKVLVLDEPTTGLDVSTQRGILSLLRELSRELLTATAIVSHDLGVVAAMADDVLVLQHGRQLEHQPTDLLFSKPQSEHTKELLKAVPRLTGDLAPSAGSVIDATTSDTRRAPLLKIDDLIIRYGARDGPAAVDGVSLELARGQVLAIVGESGSGKSTLALALAGLLKTSSGQVQVLTTGSGDSPAGDLTRAAGKRPRDLRRRVQMIFQNADTSLNPRREVSSAIRRPIRFFGTAAGRSLDEAVLATTEDVRLPTQLLTRLPGQLSGGQRQRVGIARGLAAQPDMLIADEITTALDVSVQDAILALLDELRRERDLGCLFISHDLAVVRKIADHVVVLHQGRIVEQGPIAAVFAGPNHPYTADLFNSTLEPDPVLARPVLDHARTERDLDTLAGGPDDLGADALAGFDWLPAEGVVDLGGGHLVSRWSLSARTPAEGTV